MNEKEWRIILGCTLVNMFQAGSMYMLPNIIVPLVLESLGISVGLTPVPLGIAKVSFVFWVLVVGQIVDRLRPKACIVAGLCVLAFVSAIYPLFATGFVQVCILHFLLSMGGALTSLPVIALLLAGWFDEGNYATALGLVQAAFSSSGIILAPLMAIVATTFSWRASWLLLSSGLWFCAFTARQVIENAEMGVDTGDLAAEEEEYIAARNEGAEKNRTRTIGQDLRGLVCFFVLTVIYFGIQYTFGTFQDNLVVYLSMSGMSLSSSSAYFSAFCLFILVGTVLAGRLVDHYETLHIIAGAQIMCMLGMAMIFLTPDKFQSGFSLPIVLLTTIHGIGYGISNNCSFVLVPEHFEPEILGRVQSFFFAIGVLGNVTGSATTGTLRELAGSYRVGFFVAFCLSLLSSLSSLFLHVMFQGTAEDYIFEEEVETDAMLKPTKSMSLMKGTTNSLLRGGKRMSWMVDSGALSSSFVPASSLSRSSYQRTDKQSAMPSAQRMASDPVATSLPAFAGSDSVAISGSRGSYVRSHMNFANAMRMREQTRSQKSVYGAINKEEAGLPDVK